MNAYIPGAQVRAQPIPNPDIRITQIESSLKSFRQNGNDLTLHDRWHGVVKPDFYHLLYGAVRNRLLKRSVYCLHAACVGNAQGYVLILGHSGAGKTSTLLELASAHDWQVFSGNKVAAKFNADGLLEAIAGTDTITLATPDMSRYPALAADAIQYGNRSASRLAARQYSEMPSVRVKAIALVRLNDKEMTTEKLSPLSALHTLYPFFLDTVNASAIVGDGAGIYAPPVRLATHKKLLKQVRQAAERIPMYRITGTCPAVAAEIARL